MSFIAKCLRIFLCMCLSAQLLHAQELKTRVRGEFKYTYIVASQKVISTTYEDSLEHNRTEIQYMFPLALEKANIYDYNYGINSSYFSNGILQSQEAHVNNFVVGLQFERYLNGKPKQLKFINGLEVMWMTNGEVLFTKRKNIFTGYYEPADTARSVLNQWYRTLCSREALEVLQTPEQFIVTTFLQDTLLFCSRKNYVSHGAWFARHDRTHPFHTGTDYEGKPCGTFTRYHYHHPFPVRTEIFDQTFGPNAQLSMVLEYNQDHAWLQRKQRYTRGIEDGWQVTYHQNGMPSDSFLMKMGKNGGLHISLKENGKPFRIMHYNSDGKYEGKVKYWYFGEYGDGLMQEENYKNGVREDRAYYYYPNGKLKLTGRYVNGKEDGRWYWYDDNGALLQQLHYVNGIKQIEKNEAGECHDPTPPGNRFIQNLQSFAGEDSAFFHAREFIYHESVWNLLDDCFADNTQFNGEANRSQEMYFDLVAYEFIDVHFPNPKGFYIRLNPCWHLGEESRINTSLSYSERYPENNRVELETAKARLIIPYILKTEKGKPYFINLRAEKLIFTNQGLYANNIKLPQYDSARVGKCMKLLFENMHVMDLLPDSFESKAFQAEGKAQLHMQKKWVDAKIYSCYVSNKRFVLKLEYENIADTTTREKLAEDVRVMLNADGFKNATVKNVHEMLKFRYPEGGGDNWLWSVKDYLFIEIPMP